MLKYNDGGIIEDYAFNSNEDYELASFSPIKYGLNTMESGLIAKEDVLPKSDIYIQGYTVTGSICMSLNENNGSIYVFYSDDERINLASSFTEFINGLSPM